MARGSRVYVVLTLLLMTIAGSLGRCYGRRPDFPEELPAGPPALPVPAPVPKKSGAPRSPALAAPKLLNLGELQANIRKYYPQAEHRAGKEGRVTMSLVVGTDGAVGGIRVETSGGAAFDEAAKKVVSAMRFSPARRSGAAVAVEISERIDFQFDK